MSKWDSLVVSLWCGKYEYDIKDDVKWYRTFGNHDIMSITPIEGETGNDILQGMWLKANQFSKKINAGESIHNLYAASDDCGKFWDNEKPFLFVNALQINFDNDKKLEDQFDTFKNNLKDILHQLEYTENDSYALYNSLDCGDILLFLKTDSYIEGANVINHITTKSYVKHYGYSICGVDLNLFFNSPDTGDETISKVVICSTFNKVAFCEKWFASLIKEYPNIICYDSEAPNIDFDEAVVSFTRLGNEDICINIFNCNLKHFLKMISSESGIFSYKNELLKKAFTRLRIQFDSSLNSTMLESKQIEPTTKSLINSTANQWKDKLEGLSSPYVYKAIVEVLSALENLENQAFAFDVQDCIRNIFPLFIKKIDEIKANTPSGLLKNFDKHLIHFTTGLMSIANGSLHADKLFINVPGFNAVICDVPSKLLSYYTAYIQKLVKVLNKNRKNDYRFLICPDLYIGIEVERLFNYKNDDSLLLKARIPVKKLFEPQTLFMELSHEVAHFVGNEIRQREKRIVTLANIIAYTVADRLLRPKALKPVQFGDRHIEKNVLLSFFPNKSINNHSIDNLLKNEWKSIPEFIKTQLIKSCDFCEESLYLSTVRRNLQKTLFDLLSDDYKKPIQNKILEVLIGSSDGCYDIDDPYFLSKITDRHVTHLLLNELNKIVHYSCMLCYESFADLVMLYITNDIQAYLKNIYESEKKLACTKDGKVMYPWQYNQIGEMKFERIISVINALDYNLDNELKNANSNDPTFNEFLEAIRIYSEGENEDTRASSFITIQENQDYLMQCLNELKKLNDELEPLRDLYKAATKKDNLNSCISKFRKSAFEFRTMLLEDSKT